MAELKIEIDDKLLEKYRKVSSIPFNLMLEDLVEEGIKALNKTGKGHINSWKRR